MQLTIHASIVVDGQATALRVIFIGLGKSPEAINL
jgi:hypothetical protein